MANVLVEEQYLQDIADAIRVKNGSNNTYTPAQMANAISSITTGGNVNEVTKSGTHIVVPTGFVNCDVDVINQYMSRKVIKIR